MPIKELKEDPIFLSWKKGAKNVHSFVDLLIQHFLFFSSQLTYERRRYESSADNMLQHLYSVINLLQYFISSPSNAFKLRQVCKHSIDGLWAKFTWIDRKCDFNSHHSWEAWNPWLTIILFFVIWSEKHVNFGIISRKKC